jgi:outer membrane protein
MNDIHPLQGGQMKSSGYIQNGSPKKPIGAILIIWIVSGLGITGFAEPLRTVTLDQAIEIALQNNLDLKQVSNQVTLSQISLKQKKSNFLPNISLSAQSSRLYAKSLNIETNEYINGNNQSSNLSASFNLNLFNGGYDISALRQSRFELRASQQNFTRYQQSIIFETIQLYIQVVLAGELIEVDKKNLEAQLAQLERIEVFFEAGRRPVADLYQQKAEISRYEYLLLNTERNYQVNKLLLSRILGSDPGTDYKVSNPGIEHLINKVRHFNLETIVKEAREQRPDIHAQQNQIQAATNEIRAARAGYWPKLNFFADAGTSYNSSIEGIGFSDQFLDNHPNASIGLSLSIPVFDKNTTRNSVAMAKVNLNNQQLEMQKLFYQVSIEVQQAIQDYATAKKQITVAETQEKYSQAARESVEERYNVNAATMAELIQVRSQYHQSLYDLVEAKFNLLIRGIAISFYKGDSERMISLLKI